MTGRILIASARGAVLGMVLGTAVSSALGMVASRFDAGTTAFVIVYYLAPPIGAVLGANAAARGLAQDPRNTVVLSAVTASAVVLGEAALVWLGWWLERFDPAPGNPLLGPTALLAPVAPAVLLSAVGAALARRGDDGMGAEPRRSALLTGVSMLLGAVLGLPLGFFAATSIGMAYAESMGVCSIGAIGHAALGVVIGPLVGAWMARWAAIKWGDSLTRPVA